MSKGNRKIFNFVHCVEWKHFLIDDKLLSPIVNCQSEMVVTRTLPIHTITLLRNITLTFCSLYVLLEIELLV